MLFTNRKREGTTFIKGKIIRPKYILFIFLVNFRGEKGNWTVRRHVRVYIIGFCHVMFDG